MWVGQCFLFFQLYQEENQNVPHTGTFVFGLSNTISLLSSFLVYSIIIGGKYCTRVYCACALFTSALKMKQS